MYEVKGLATCETLADDRAWRGRGAALMGGTGWSNVLGEVTCDGEVLGDMLGNVLEMCTVKYWAPD